MGKKAFRFYDWKDSATGQWSVDTGLHRLRDDSVSNLARDLWESGICVQTTAAIELMAHGNPRKAAEFVRELRDQHILLGHKIRAQYGTLADYLFDSPLETLPSSPEEYSILSRVQAGINSALGR